MKIGLAGPFAVRPFVPPADTTLPSSYRDIVDWTPVCDLAVSLSKRGHDVSVFTLNPTVTEPYELRSAHFRIVVGPMRPRARSRMIDFNAGEVRQLCKLFGSVALDVIHAHWTYEYALAAAKRSTPHVVTVHDCPPVIFRHQHSLYRFLRMIVGIRGMRSGTNLTTVSPYMLPCISRWTGRSAAVIPNMLDDDFVRSPRRRCGTTVLAVANGFKGLKNTSSLLESFAQVRASQAEATLVLVGADHGPGEEAYYWARDRGLDQGVAFLGRLSREEVAALMDTSDALVHVSREESFGMVLVEAMARGLPVVADGSAGAVPWVVGDAGILVDTSDIDALACAIQGILSDDAEWERLSGMGCEAVRERFTYSVVTPQYEQAYRDALERA